MNLATTVFVISVFSIFAITIVYWLMVAVVESLFTYHQGEHRFREYTPEFVKKIFRAWQPGVYHEDPGPGKDRKS